MKIKTGEYRRRNFYSTFSKKDVFTDLNNFLCLPYEHILSFLPSTGRTPPFSYGNQVGFESDTLQMEPSALALLAFTFDHLSVGLLSLAHAHPFNFLTLAF
jgi:hypothetical protein